MEEKICSKCEQKYPATTEYFYKDSKVKIGLCARCKICTKEMDKKYKERKKKLRRINDLRKKYGIEMEDFNNMIKKQGRKCMVCGIYMEKIDIDHNHKTGEVRGLLCHGCNTGIGLFKENIFSLIKAAKYLRGWKRWEKGNNW